MAVSFLKKRFPFNKKQFKIIFALFTCLFSSAFSITMLFPFIPFMIQFLLPSIDPTSVGTYAGMVASSMFAGRFFGSYIWGLLSDIWGKKRVLIISELLLGLSSLSFGFSVNIYMAIILRFSVGLSNGIIGTAKAAISEVCTDKTQPLALGVLTAAFGVGLVIGPAVSGAIADPITQYNLTINNNALNNFLTLFPYSLPGIVNFLLCILGMILAIVLLPSTKKPLRPSLNNIELSNTNTATLDNIDEKKKEEENFTEERRDDLTIQPLTNNEDTLSSDGITSDIIEEEQTIDNDNNNGDITQQHREEEINMIERDEILREEEEGKEDEIHLISSTEDKKTNHQKRKSSYVLSIIPGRRTSASLQYIKIPRSLKPFIHSVREEEEEREEEANDKQIKRSWFKQRLLGFKKGIIRALKDLKMFAKNPTTRLALAIYCIYSFVVIGFDELYSLWCSTAPHLGGIGFSLYDIGISLTVMGVILLPFSLFIFPALEKCFGSIKAFQLTTIIQLFFILLFPSIHFILLTGQDAALWIILCVVGFILRAVTTVGFGATALFINNSVTFDKLGSLNGLAISLTSLFRSFSPLFVGAIYSASLSTSNQSIGFPVDYHLIFIILSFILLIVVLMSTGLPLTINKQKLIQESNL